MHTIYDGAKWSEPDTVFDHAKVPFITHDNKHLLFIYDKGKGYPTADIWMSTRGEHGWESPLKLGFPISTDNADEVEISEAANGTLYFSSGRTGGYGGLDVYKSELVNGEYKNAENLSIPINTYALDECPYIAPDESFLVFNSWKYNPKFKGNNLYVSFRKKDGTWSAPKDLGNGINTDELDVYPHITPDGKYLLFTRYTYGSSGWAKLYWVSSSVLDSVKELYETSSEPSTLTSDELKYYFGVYSNKKAQIKITVSQERSFLTAAFEKKPNSIILETIGQDIFWGHGVTFRFDRKNDEVTLIYDYQGSNGLVLKREK
jgi:hypothetical protein